MSLVTGDDCYFPVDGFFSIVDTFKQAMFSLDC